VWCEYLCCLTHSRHSYVMTKIAKGLSRSNGQKTEREWDESKADRVRIGSDGSTADRER
jgi:hypothetical protein